jgi:hypothetical protein
LEQAAGRDDGLSMTTLFRTQCLVPERRDDDTMNGTVSPLVADNADVIANGWLVADRIGFRGICYSAKNSGIEKGQAHQGDEITPFDHWYALLSGLERSQEPRGHQYKKKKHTIN